MDNYRLIQNKYGNVYRYVGDVLPDGCQWMPPDVGPCRILGVWKEPAQVREKEIRETRGIPRDENGKPLMRARRYSRVVGYLSAVEDWGVGKKQEWKERKTYSVDKALGDNG